MTSIKPQPQYILHRIFQELVDKNENPKLMNALQIRYQDPQEERLIHGAIQSCILVASLLIVTPNPDFSFLFEEYFQPYMQDDLLQKMCRFILEETIKLGSPFLEQLKDNPSECELLRLRMSEIIHLIP